jgi:EPS-associated MarR family transcriptional regulator
MNNELSIKLIRELEKAPKQSQRTLSRQCGVSLGSIHYCISALIEKGCIKAQNFKNAKNKLAYSYILTPKGIAFKKDITIAFLKQKKIEYDELQKEIQALEEDLAE